jgi:hypothetical protein
MKVYFPVKKRSRPDPSYSLAVGEDPYIFTAEDRSSVPRPGCHFSIAIDRAREERLTKQARTTQQQTCVACGQLRGEDGGSLRLLHLREAGQSSPAGLPFRS